MSCNLLSDVLFCCQMGCRKLLGRRRAEMNEQNEVVKDPRFQERFFENKPSKISTARKTTLTLPLMFEYEQLSKANGKGPGEKFEQRAISLLLTEVPLDIRIIIWKLALTAPNVGLFRGRGRLLHVLQDNEEIMSQPYSRPVPDFPRNRTQTQILALLKTCRQIYSEAIDILYKTNSFALYQNDTIFDLQRTILPHRFASIRFLTLHWQFRYDLTFEPTVNRTVTKPRAPWDIETWDRACSIMAHDMPGLREILIVVKGPFQSTDHIASMLQYLREIYVEKEYFWVRVPMPKSMFTTGPDIEIVNFRSMIGTQNFPFNVFRDCIGYPDSDPGPDRPVNGMSEKGDENATILQQHHRSSQYYQY